MPFSYGMLNGWHVFEVRPGINITTAHAICSSHYHPVLKSWFYYVYRDLSLNTLGMYVQDLPKNPPNNRKAPAAPAFYYTTEVK